MSKDNPTIIAFVSDMMFAPKINNVAAKLGFTVEWVDSAETYGAASKKEAPGEPLRAGQEATLTRELSSKQPDLLLFDLDNQSIPWKRWIAVLKSSPATRRIPILSYGSHVNTANLEAAHKAGADGVVSRGRFSEKLPDLINKHTRTHDYAAIVTACEQPLSELAVQGIALFNDGQFYEAHHGLEDAWNEDKGPARDLYRAILQVAVAYLQVERGNYRGAAKMFLRVKQWLDPLPDQCRGVNIKQIVDDVNSAEKHLVALGPDNIKDFDRTYFKPITYN